MWKLLALGPRLGAEGRGPLGALLPGAPEAPEPLGARPSGAAAPAPAQGSVWPLQLHLLFLVPHAGFRLLHLIQDRPVSRTPSTSILF